MTIPDLAVRVSATSAEVREPEKEPETEHEIELVKRLEALVETTVVLLLLEMEIYLEIQVQIPLDGIQTGLPILMETRILSLKPILMRMAMVVFSYRRLYACAHF